MFLNVIVATIAQIIVKIKNKIRTQNKLTIYKYLSLAYLSPRIIGAIMDSNVPTHVNLQTLFGIASKHEGFREQEAAFFGT